MSAPLADDGPMPTTRNLGQKIALTFAGICFLAAAACAVAAVLYESRSPNDAIRASLLASVVFFGGSGIVLYVIGTARLKGLLSGPRDDEGSAR